MAAPPYTIGLTIPDRAPTPCDGRAQYYRRPGDHSTQSTRTFLNGTSMTFGPRDFVEDFQPGDAFFEQILVIESAKEDIRDLRQRYHVESYRGASFAIPRRSAIPMENETPVDRSQIILGRPASETGRYDSGYNNYVQRQAQSLQRDNRGEPRGIQARISTSLSANVYQSQNWTNFPGLAHPSFSTNTSRGGLQRNIQARITVGMANPYCNSFENGAHEPAPARPTHNLGGFHLVDRGVLTNDPYARHYHFNGFVDRPGEVRPTRNVGGSELVDRGPLANDPYARVHQFGNAVDGPDQADLVRSIGGLQIADRVATADKPATPINQFDKNDKPATAVHRWDRNDMPATPVVHQWDRNDMPATHVHQWDRNDMPVTHVHQWDRNDMPATPVNRFNNFNHGSDQAGGSSEPSEPYHPSMRALTDTRGGLSGITEVEGFESHRYGQNDFADAVDRFDMDRGLHWPDIPPPPPLIYEPGTPQGMVNQIEFERHAELLKEVLIVVSFPGELDSAGNICPPVQYYRLYPEHKTDHPWVVDLDAPRATLEWVISRNVNWRNNNTTWRSLGTMIQDHHQRDQSLRFLRLEREADGLADARHITTNLPPRFRGDKNKRNNDPSPPDNKAYKHRNVPHSPSPLPSRRGRNRVRSIGMEDVVFDEVIPERVYAGGPPRFEGGKTFNEMVGLENYPTPSWARSH